MEEWLSPWQDVPESSSNYRFSSSATYFESWFLRRGVNCTTDGIWLEIEWLFSAHEEVLRFIENYMARAVRNDHRHSSQHKDRLCEGLWREPHHLAEVSKDVEALKCTYQNKLYFPQHHCPMGSCSKQIFKIMEEDLWLCTRERCKRSGQISKRSMRWTWDDYLGIWWWLWWYRVEQEVYSDLFCKSVRRFYRKKESVILMWVS